ncbi:hypothetical protein EC844_11520 [Acinetobacter calcoaceticus]|uniref:Uncharacterized protein n=1 Tax=Acinetobacter calcoaceticus TaxID=471 RepID=A0A4R1XPU5_ACICA|nr:hypothetical protein EC844_11520 [Acinetobacter calcoaceticus]
MSQSLDGLHFSLDPITQKSSSAVVGKAILAEALALIDHHTAQQVLEEKNWRKNYPQYFKSLVEHGIRSTQDTISIAKQGLHKAHHSFDFYRHGQRYLLKDVMDIAAIEKLYSIKITGQSQQAPEWYIPYHGQKLTGQALSQQLDAWTEQGIIEPSHAQALKHVQAHPEWLDLSQRTMVLFGAGSEAGPLQWLAKWKANIIAIDLPNPKVWEKIITTVRDGNATLYAPCLEDLPADMPLDQIQAKVGANLLTQIPEIAHWLAQHPQQLDLAAIAYLDGEKHVRVSMAMDSIMSYISTEKPDSSLMYMCTPTDVYAVSQDTIHASTCKYQQRSALEKVISKGVSTLSMKNFFKRNNQQLIQADNDKCYGISDCIVVEQGPNYALAKRLQQWRATLSRHQGQQVSINIAPSTTTRSVTKNPLLKAAFSGAKLFDVEAFEPETTNAIMAALWVHDLCHPHALANPSNTLEHPLELMMDGANHGGLWHVGYLARTALPFAALYGFAAEKVPVKKLWSKLKSKATPK